MNAMTPDEIRRHLEESRERDARTRLFFVVMLVVLPLLCVLLDLIG